MEEIFLLVIQKNLFKMKNAFNLNLQVEYNDIVQLLDDQQFYLTHLWGVEFHYLSN